MIIIIMIMIITNNFATLSFSYCCILISTIIIKKKQYKGTTCLDQLKMPEFPPNFWQAPSRCKRDGEPLVVHAHYKWLQLWEYHGTYPLLNSLPWKSPL